MKTTGIRLIILLLIIGTFSACTLPDSTSKASERYPFSKINYYLRYMTQNRELQAEMTFRTDSTVAIEGDVLLNDEAMVFKKLPMVGLQYRLIKNAVTFDQSYTFSYTEKNGSLAEVNAKIGAFSNLRFASDGLSIEKGGLLQWDGDVLGRDDGLVFIFTDSKGTTFTINHAGITKGKEFEIINSHANQLALGPATLLTVRKRTILAHKNNLTQMVSIEYYLGALEFEVKK
jgi:hypothetical protein